MALASMILGIIALVIAVFGGFVALGWLGSICGILAIVFGVLGRKDAANKGKATAGLICGIIAVVWGIIAYLACVACVNAAGEAAVNAAAAGLLNNF